MNFQHKVLVDSSVWIDFFRNGNQPQLELLITEDLACTNELILTELLPAIENQRKNELNESLLALEIVPLSIDWDLIRRYQTMNIKNGVNKVGIPDLMILQQVIEQKMTLMSLDKHFKLMNNSFSFDLIMV